ncbi:MAG: RNA polymerase sigma factor [Bryobacteraceae bacterium]
MTDEAVMRQVQDGDVRRLALLFDRHHAALYRFYVRMTGNRELSEDLVQEVFWRMLRYRETYRNDAPLATWMYRIARNAYIDQARKRKHEVELAEDWDVPARPAESIEQREEHALLRRALLALPHDKREVLILARYQELPYERIAELLGCEAGTVKGRVHRAIRTLRETYLELAGRKAS